MEKYGEKTFNKIKETYSDIQIQDDKYNQKSKIQMTCKICYKSFEIGFAALERNFQKKVLPCCRSCMYENNKKKISETKKIQNQTLYDTNSEELKILSIELKFEIINIPENLVDNTLIAFKCNYPDCIVNTTKQFKSLKHSKMPYCQMHHYEIHNGKINEKLKIENQDQFDEYNKELDELKEKYPQVELCWDRDNIRSHSSLSFLCINSKCKLPISKLYQHILQKNGPIEVYFGCDECKFYISESLIQNTLLKDTEQFNELIEIPKQIDYITTHSSSILKWKCKNKCNLCNNNHLFDSSPNYRFVQHDVYCPICVEPNKCICIKDGFICSICNKYFDNTENKTSSGNCCKQCTSNKKNDIEKLFQVKIKNCIRICERREGNRSMFDLTVEYLKELYEKQNGKCYISGKELSTNMHSDWKISIERLNQNNGYIKENIAFICLEFQSGFRQWNKEKFQQFCENYPFNEEIIENFDEKCKQALVKNTIHLKKRKIQQKAFNDEINKKCLCRTCDKIKDYDDFSDYGIKYGKCKDCHKIHNDKRKKTPSLRLKLHMLISGSKSGIDKRNKSKNRKENQLTHTLTFEELLEIYINQNGRCAYSNKILSLSDDWMMSLERKDIKIGYTKENCCLICIEFNVGDWSILKNDYDEREGSSGWSKEKVEIIVKQFINEL